MYYQPELQYSPDEILVYLRKSRSDDPLLTVEEVLNKHETILNEWSERNLGQRIPEKNKFREIVSGETIDDRPEIKKVLSLIESPQYKAILIVEVQRLSRGDLEDAGRLIKLLRYTNTLVITPQKTYNLQDEYDRDFFERELKRGNEFLEYQKKIMTRGRILSVQQGNYIGSKAPYGYERTTISDGKKKCPTLKIKENEAAVVKMIFDMYVNEDLGCTNIAHRLDNLGIKPPKGEFWSPPALKDMLENIHYTGKVKWNWRKTVTVVEEGEILKTRPKSKISEYLVFNGKHQAIITDELFEAAQKKRGRNHRAKPTTKIRNPFASLVFCQCGRAMSLRTYKKDGIERSAPRILCDNQANCHTPSCLYDDILKMVCEALENEIQNFEIELSNKNKDNSIALHTQHIQYLEKRLKELQAKELAQWEAQTDPDLTKRMPQDIFQQLKEKLSKEKETIQQALREAYATKSETTDYKEKLFKFKDALNALQNSDTPPETKNKYLKTCIQRIDYNRGTTDKKAKKTEGTTTVRSSWSINPVELDIKFLL